MSSALTVYQQLAGEKFTPNPMQEELFTRITAEGENPALLLKAPTGSGKQRLFLFRALTPSAGFSSSFLHAASLMIRLIGVKSTSSVHPKKQAGLMLLLLTPARSLFALFSRMARHWKKGDVISTMVMLSLQPLTNSCTDFSDLVNLTSLISSHSAFITADNRIFSASTRFTPTIRSLLSILNVLSRHSTRQTWI